MRIVLVTQGAVWRPGGSYRVIYEYANQLHRLGAQVLVLQPLHAGGASGCRVSGPRLHSFCTTARRRLTSPRPTWFDLDPAVEVATIRSFASILHKTTATDAVLLTSWRLAEALGATGLHYHRRVAYLIHHDEGLGGYDQARVRSTWELDLAKIFVSGHVYEEARRRRLAGCHLIVNGIDHGRYHVLGTPRSSTRVVMALVDKKTKDPRTGVQAFEIAEGVLPDIRLETFGAGRRPTWLAKRFVYHRGLPDAEIVKLYNGAAVFLSSSIVEGFCLPAAEAMACGAALVATDSGGLREFAFPEENALLSRPGDPLALGLNIARALSDAGLRQRLVVNGLLSIQQLDWRQAGQKLHAVLSGLDRPTGT